MSAQAPQKKKQAKNTQLTDVMDFSADRKVMKEELRRRLIIDPPVAGSVPSSSVPISFNRVGLGIVNNDGTQGELIVAFDRSFCFGVSESRQDVNGAPGPLNGYSVAISMYDRDGATEKQLRTIMFIEVLAELITEHLLTEESKAAMNKWDLEASELKKINPLFYKKERGKIVDGASPTFYPKLIWWKAGKDKQGRDKEARMATVFYSEDEIDENGEQAQVNPLDFLGMRCYITPAIKFESIFLGSKNNLQCKVYEAEIKAAETGPKRLLKVVSRSVPSVSIASSSSSSSNSSSSSLAVSSVASLLKKSDENVDGDIDGDIDGLVAKTEQTKLVPSDNEEEEQKPKIRKIKAKVKQ